MPLRIPIPDHLDGVPFRTSDGARFGLSPTRLRRSDLTRPYHGVRTTAPVDDLASRVRAYALVATDEAFFCGPTAAALHGFPLPLRLDREESLHVAVPNPHRAPRGVGIVGHKFVVTPAEVTDLDGVHVTTLARTWCDLAPHLSLVELVAAGDWLLRTHPTVAEELGLLAERHPARAARSRRRTALGLIDPRSESPKETDVRLALIFGGLTGFVPNLEIRAFGHLYRLDLAWPAAKIALEYQGGYHNDPAQWRRDLTRRQRLEALGWTVVFIGADDLRDPTELLARIRMLAARAAVPTR